MDNNTSVRIRSFLARCVCKFISDGCNKAYGVILEKFVDLYRTYHFTVGWSLTIQVGACFLVAPIVKLLRSRLRCNVICILGGVLAGLGYLGHSIVPTLGIWQLFLYSLMTGLGFGLCNMATVLFLKEAFQESFPKAYATSLLSSFSGIAILPLLSDFLLRTYGEVIDMAVFSALCFSLIVPIGFIMSNAEDESSHSPKFHEHFVRMEDMKGEEEVTKGQKVIDYIRLDDDSVTSESANLLQKSEENETNSRANKSKNLESSLRQTEIPSQHSLFKDHPFFILYFVVCGMFGYNYSSWSIFLIPLGEFTGLEPSTAVWMSTCGGLGGISGNVYSFIMVYLDFIDEVNGLILPTALVALSFSLVLLSTSFTSMAVFSYLSGFGIAVQGVITTSQAREAVCEEHFETALVMMYFGAGLTTQVGGVITGGIVDVSGSYFYSFGFLSVLNLIVSIGVLTFFIYLKYRKS